MPRIARLIALDTTFQDLLERGEACGYANLVRPGYVTRARLARIMNLLLLAAEIQNETLSLDADAGQNRPAERHSPYSIATLPIAIARELLRQLPCRLFVGMLIHDAVALAHRPLVNTPARTFSPWPEGAAVRS